MGQNLNRGPQPGQRGSVGRHHSGEQASDLSSPTFRLPAGERIISPRLIFLPKENGNNNRNGGTHMQN